MRIIAGKWRGRQIQAPKGRDTRPTGDRVREALFSSLHSRIGAFEGLRVLDVFAGSGALGFESLSRGAAFLAAVELDPKACRIIEGNYHNLQGRQDHAAAEASNTATVARDPSFRLYRGDAYRLASRLRGLGVDLAFFDPPYDLKDEMLYELLETFDQVEVFARGSILVIERPGSSLLESMLPDGLSLLGTKDKGDTRLYFVCRELALQ